MTVSSPSIWSALGIVALSLMLLAASWFDMRTRRIPNSVVGLGALAGLTWTLSPVGPGLWMSVLGGLVAFLTFWVLHGLGWMGAGDVKLAGATGLYFTPSHALALCLTIFIAGGVMALIWRCSPRAGLQDTIPYGVAIALGTAWHVWRQAGL